MKQTFSLPKLKYIVFELVKIGLDDYMNNNYRATVEETIYLAVMPQQFQYRLMSRDAITQTDSRVFLNRYDYQPERCSISGHFGIEPRFVAGTIMDGWTRLDVFEKEIIIRSKKSEFPDEGTPPYIYALNYYDFWFHRFGNINVETWNLHANAKENTQLPRYSLDFLIIGGLIKAEGTDPMLWGLKNLASPGGILDNGLASVNSVLAEAESYTSLIGAGVAGIQAAASLINGGIEFVQGMENSDVSRTYTNVENLFG
ncbi:MAG: hypothetical protein RDU14_16775 [Melioribacteraceae bacterium]|nr:hypothetical protein [Melioribacteraceae bacterium]